MHYTWWDGQEIFNEALVFKLGYKEWVEFWWTEIIWVILGKVNSIYEITTAEK